MAAHKKATSHWMLQRISALILFPLVVWFVTSLVMMAGADYDAVLLWITHPIMAAFMLIMIVAGLYHLNLGLNEVIEDYIETSSTKKTLKNLNAGFSGVLAIIMMFSILKLVL